MFNLRYSGIPRRSNGLSCTGCGHVRLCLANENRGKSGDIGLDEILAFAYAEVAFWQCHYSHWYP